QGLVKNRGAIILTAHLGNFPLIALKLAKMGYTVNLVIRPMREKNADKYFHKLRDRGGVKTIKSYPRKECVSKILKALKNNELVVLLMDQNFGTGGVWVKFFNILAATPIGAVVLGLRTGTAIMPSYIYQEKAGRHCLRILPEFELIKTENNDETILLNVIKISRLMEDWIRKYVNQWTWIHRRWKSRPSKEILNSKFKVEK
ncbi:MAG: lysophospholipid acyltransferase family protein, partial [Candidatus Omnitrophica bacterium]|nr:lysophospholipid acyltransferase family protein [Candidatus Omnitrophota bacterium]